jgi:hypothetical protein
MIISESALKIHDMMDVMKGFFHAGTERRHCSVIWCDLPKYLSTFLISQNDPIRPIASSSSHLLYRFGDSALALSSTEIRSAADFPRNH